MSYTPGLWLFILASAIITGLFLYSWQFRKTETGKAFIGLMICALIWAGGFTLETASQSLAHKLFWSNLEFLGITFLPLAWVFLVIAYTGMSLQRRYWALLAVVPTLTNLVIWTNPIHHWFMGTPAITTKAAPFPVLFQDYRFWFYFIHAPTGYLYLMAALILLVRALRSMDPVYRPQGRLLLLAILLPSITDVAYVLGFSPVRYYNYSTAVFSISGILLAWALFRYRFLDLVPLAYHSVIDHLSDAVLILDDKNRIVEINHTARQIFKIDEQVIGQNIQEAPGAFLRKVGSLIQDGQTQMDVLSGDPPDHYYDLRINPVLNQSHYRIGWVLTLRDITERVQLFNQIEDLAIHDSLTEVFNRRHFRELCNLEIARILRFRDHSIAMIMIDLDEFKNINDTYGHISGDTVLINFAHTIQSQLRAIDLFGRIGGEEFAVLLVNVTADEALITAERLRSAIEAMQTQVNDDLITITASFGVVSSQQLTEPDLTVDRFFQLADQALYQAKQGGRNTVVIFTPPQ